MRARAAAGAAFALAALATARPARAGLPDWAKEIAKTAPEVPDGVPEWPSRYLLYETRLTISGDGATWRWRARRAAEILSARVDDVQMDWIHRSGNARVRSSKGWHVPPGEKAQRDIGRAIDLQVSPDFSSDRNSRAVLLEGVRKGSLLFTEYDYDDPGATLSLQVPFGSTSGPVDLERLVIELPPGWSLRWAWIRSDGGAPQRTGDSWTFERRDERPPEVERLGPSPADRLPLLVVGMIPPEGEPAKLPAFRDWNEVSSWASGLQRGKDAADPALAKAVGAAWALAGTDPLARIRQGALLVRDRVRYLAREVGIGGYAPQSASDTFAQAIGDCKAKATLFRAVLGAGGVPSYTVLVNGTSPDTVSDAVPTPNSFDHEIVAVPWPGGPVPPESAPAVADVPGLGKMLIVDTTDDYASPGTLPYALAGKRALLVDGERGILFTIPEGTPEANRIETHATVTVRRDRSASATVEMRYYGAYAETRRASQAGDALARERAAEDDVREAWGGAVVQGYAVAREGVDGAYVESFTVELRPGAPELGDGAMPVFPGATQPLARVALARRTLPVVYDAPARLRYEISLEGVSPQASLPGGETSAGEGWSIATAYERREGVVHASWTLDRARVRFEPAAFPELKKLWAAASRSSAARLPIAP